MKVVNIKLKQTLEDMSLPFLIFLILFLNSALVISVQDTMVSKIIITAIIVLLLEFVLIKFKFDSMDKMKLDNAKASIDIFTNLFLLVLIPIFLFLAFPQSQSTENDKTVLKTSEVYYKVLRDTAKNEDERKEAMKVFNENTKLAEKIKSEENKSFWTDYSVLLVSSILGISQFMVIVVYEFQIYKRRKLN